MTGPPSTAPLVLGFDIRVPIAGLGSWTDGRRRLFLIRPDVAQPLSVDRLVWPVMVAPEPGVNPFDLWNSVGDATSVLAGRERLSKQLDSPALVEIAVLAEGARAGYWQRLMAGYLGPQLRSGAVSTEELGFDVADRYLLSGLSNCVFQPSEISALRQVWTSRINALGLICNAEWAAKYTEVCDRLVPEHAPFYVYRLTRVVVAGRLRRFLPGSASNPSSTTTGGCTSGP